MKQDFQEVHFFSKALDYERCAEVRNYFRTQKSMKPKMTDDCKEINCHDCKEILLQARGY